MKGNIKELYTYSIHTDNIEANKLSVSEEELTPSVDLNKYSSYDYVKPVYNELGLGEKKALNDDPINTLDQLVPRKSITSKPLSAASPASFIMQYLLLMQRILICARRNYVSVYPRNIVRYNDDKARPSQASSFWLDSSTLSSCRVRQAFYFQVSSQ